MQETDVRINPRDDFAIQIQHKTENTVSGRMLRTEVERYLRLVSLICYGFGSSAHDVLPGLPLAAFWPSGMM